MPVFLLGVPLPTLRDYTVASVLVVAISLQHAVHVTSSPGWKTSRNATVIPSDGLERGEFQRDLPNIIFGNSTTNSSGNMITDVATYMLQEPMCVWTLINMTYCCLLILGRIIQHLVFGDLRVSERQHVKDKFWNFIFYKFIFVFGVINVQYMDEVVLWVAWFTALGFLNLLTQLCKDRFEYLSFSATSGGWAGARLAVLLGVILALDGVLMMLCVAIAVLGGGLNTFAFMCAECILLSIRATHVLFRYTMHVMEARGAIAEDESLFPRGFHDQQQEEQENDENDRHQNAMNSASSMSGPTRDRRAPLAHYAELCFDLVALTVDLVHHVHMLLWSNIFLSMASLVICMQLRYLFHEIQRKVKKHRNYVWVLNHMERNYPMATTDELKRNSDNCAICWEKMDSARKLPCNHLFHNSCLSSWLQQDTSCPTCRMGLALWPTRSSSSDVSSQPRQPDHFFHFDGSRYVSWLPSFSVEVTHRIIPEPPATNSQIDAMARQVQQLFPHFPLSYLGRDLMTTHSVELTVDNILDGRLVLPQRLVTVEDDNDAPLPSGLSSSTPQVPSSSPSTAAPSQVLLHHSLSMVASQLVNQQHQHTAAAGNSRDSPEPTTSADSSDVHTALGGRFSKCPHEREKLLRARKEQILNIVKKKYLEKLETSKKRDVTFPPNSRLNGENVFSSETPSFSQSGCGSSISSTHKDVNDSSSYNSYQSYDSRPTTSSQSDDSLRSTTTNFNSDSLNT